MSNVITNPQTTIDNVESRLVRDILTSSCAVANTRKASRYSISPRKQGDLHVFKIAASAASTAACEATIEQLKHHGVSGWEIFNGKSNKGNVVGLKKII